MVKILLIGNGAREHAIAETFKESRKKPSLVSYMKAKNPGIAKLSDAFEIGNYNELDLIKKFALREKPDFAFIGPEDPLAHGVADLLEIIGIPCVGPKKALAQLEASKSFTRELMKEYNIEGNPQFMVFDKFNISTAKNFIESLKGIVVKPDGLTGGKGVKVQGDHFKTKKEALDYCNEVLKTHPSVVIEEKFEGEEFSLQCITDGKTVLAFPPVQDHKRAFNDDKGPNTGGMGSYTDEKNLLPFLTKKDVLDGLKITQKVAKAIYMKTGQHYKGIMYAGLIATKDGVKLIEYNARFGDPEAMNVLPLLENDLIDVCNAVIKQNLDKIRLNFKKKATVCKYIVPEGYPDNPLKNEKIEIGQLSDNAKLYYASVEQKDDGLYMTSSRAVACVGAANTIWEAENIAESAANAVKGRVFHRDDIGTKKLIEKRIRNMGNIK